MRRVNNQLAAFFDNSAQLVTRFAAHPEFVVMLVEQSDDALVLSAGIFNVNVTANVGSGAKRRTKVAGEQSMRSQAIAIIASHHGIQCDDLGGHKIGGGFDHGAGRSLNAADDVLDRCQRPKPVRRVREIGTGDSGEEIFSPTGESGNLMRDRGAEDQNCVVDARRQSTIQIHLDRIGNQSASKSLNLGVTEFSERRQLFGYIPLMIEYLTQARGRSAIRGSNLRALLVIGHGAVRALRDERVELADFSFGYDFR